MPVGLVYSVGWGARVRDQVVNRSRMQGGQRSAPHCLGGVEESA